MYLYPHSSQEKCIKALCFWTHFQSPWHRVSWQGWWPQSAWLPEIPWSTTSFLLACHLLNVVAVGTTAIPVYWFSRVSKCNKELIYWESNESKQNNKSLDAYGTWVIFRHKMRPECLQTTNSHEWRLLWASSLVCRHLYEGHIYIYIWYLPPWDPPQSILIYCLYM